MRIRRSLLTLAILLLPALSAAGQDEYTRNPGAPFVFSPQWTVQAQFAGYYAALDQGFYAEEGLDVRIIHPSATESIEERLRNKVSNVTTLQLADALEMIDAGIPLVNLLQTSMNNSLMIVSRFGKNPLEMKGARVAKWRAGFGQVAQCMAEEKHLDYEWIRSASGVNLFIAGAVDAMLVCSFNEYYQLLQTGLIDSDAAVVRLAEIGYNFPEDGLYMIREDYRKDTDRAERFARASQKGWEWVAQNQEAALDIVMEFVRQYRTPTNRTLQRLMLKEILRLQTDSQSGEMEFRLDPEMVRKTSQTLYRNQIISREIPYEELAR